MDPVVDLFDIDDMDGLGDISVMFQDAYAPVPWETTGGGPGVHSWPWWGGLGGDLAEGTSSAQWEDEPLGQLPRSARRQIRVLVRDYIRRDLGDFGASAGIISAIVGIAAAAASTAGSVISTVKKAENQAIKAARAEGASPQQIKEIRRGFRKEKIAARWNKIPKWRKKILKKQGLAPEPKTRKRRRKVTKADKHRQVAQATEAAAGWSSAAVDIMRRISAAAQQQEFGSSIDPYTGQHVIHQARTKTIPTDPGGPYHPQVAPRPPAPVHGGFRMPEFFNQRIAGVPVWALALGGAGLLVMARRR